MKLDASMIRFLTREEFRTLTAIEQGMKNHELVPTSLIVNIAKLKHGGAKKAITVLHKNKLLWHSNTQYDGYKLTYLGYDFLALRALSSREVIIGVGRQIGVGKESDIFIGYNAESREIAIKLHRLGRTSFRTIKNNRDYLQHRKSASWMYLSRLAALKEFAFMKALHEHGFPVPTPIDWSRHVVLMSLVNAYPLNQVKVMKHPAKVYSNLMNLIVKLAQYGLIHCDFNEFNLLINDNEEITIIDFPQMVSTSHINAEMYFNRDVDCIRSFFKKKFDFEADEWPVFTVDTEKKYSLDVAIAASGFSKEHQQEFEKMTADLEKAKEESDSEEDSDDDSEDEDSEEETEKLEKDEEDKIVSLVNKNNLSDNEEDVEEKKIKGELKEEKQEKEEMKTTSENAPTEEEEESDEEDETEADYIKKRVKQSLSKKNKPKVTRNSTKSRLKRDNRDAIKHY